MGTLREGEIGRFDTSTTIASTDTLLVLGSNGLKNVAFSSTAAGTVYLNVKMTDISTASSVFLASPVAGTISLIQSVIDGAIATGDTTLTAEINTVAVTGSSITVTQSGSAAGDVDSAAPSAANTVAVGDTIELITDGASTNTVAGTFTVEITL